MTTDANTNFGDTAVQVSQPSPYSISTAGTVDKAYSSIARKFGFDLTFSDTDLERSIARTENLDRDIDFTKSSKQESLLESDRDLLRGCITQLQNNLCDTIFTKRDELELCADKIFDTACNMRSDLQETIEAQIEDIKCQIKYDLLKEYEIRARIAGSSRTSYVVDAQSHAVCDAMRKLAALQAQLNTDAIKMSNDYLVNAYQTKSDAAVNAINAAVQNLLGLWGVLKGSLVCVDDEGHEDNVATNTVNEDMNQRQDTDTINSNWTNEGQQVDDDAFTFPVATIPLAP